MHHPWFRHLAATLILVVGGLASADPLLTVGGPTVEIDVDTEAVNSVLDASTDNAIKLLQAFVDAFCQITACGGTGAPQPGGGAGQQPPAEVQSVLPIPEGWEKDPRYVRITGRLPIDEATAWLAGLRVVRSTFVGDAFDVEFAAGHGLSFMTFHQPYELPEIVRSANRLDGRYAVPAGTYTVEGTSLKIPVRRLR